MRLKTGERYLKTIERGKSAAQVNLTSFNAKPINGVKLEWIGEICVTLPRGQIERLRAKAAARARKAAKTGRSPRKMERVKQARAPPARFASAPALNGSQPENFCFS